MTTNPYERIAELEALLEKALSSRNTMHNRSNELEAERDMWKSLNNEKAEDNRRIVRKINEKRKELHLEKMKTKELEAEVERLKGENESLANVIMVTDDAMAEASLHAPICVKVIMNAIEKALKTEGE